MDIIDEISNVILGHYGRSVDNHILNEFDDEDFADSVRKDIMDNDEESYNALTKGHEDSSFLAEDLICKLVNQWLAIDNNGGICDYYQIKQVLYDDFGYDIEDLKSLVVNDINNYRKEYLDYSMKNRRM